MIDYAIHINQPNERLGNRGRTLTVNERAHKADARALARRIHYRNPLIPEQVAAEVLSHFCAAAAELMAAGMVVTLDKDDGVALRITPDVHIEGGNINLERARRLMPGTVETEDDMVAHATELVERAGLRLTIRAEVRQKFTQALLAQQPKMHRKDIVERDYNKK